MIAKLNEIIIIVTKTYKWPIHVSYPFIELHKRVWISIREIQDIDATEILNGFDTPTHIYAETILHGNYYWNVNRRNKSENIKWFRCHFKNKLLYSTVGEPHSL